MGEKLVFPRCEKKKAAETGLGSAGFVMKKE